jgi:hypothetical protein
VSRRTSLSRGVHFCAAGVQHHENCVMKRHGDLSKSKQRWRRIITSIDESDDELYLQSCLTAADPFHSLNTADYASDCQQLTATGTSSKIQLNQPQVAEVRRQKSSVLISSVHPPNHQSRSLTSADAHAKKTRSIHYIDRTMMLSQFVMTSKKTLP